MLPPLAAAFVLGFSAGLRSLVPIAVLAWLGPASLGWLQALWARVVLSALALAELVTDKLPFVPARTRPGPFLGRVALGAVAGYLFTQQIAGAVMGAAGGVAGTLGGYRARRALTVRWKLPDLPVALVEDAIALGLAWLAVAG
jgi:uncharacterized membrane protein